MNIFCINAFNDDYFKTDKLTKFCLKEWEFMGIKYNIYDYNHPLVKEAKEKFKNHIKVCEERKLYNHATDPIRLYLLSKLDGELLYLDTDVIIRKKFLKSNLHENFNHPAHLGDGFAALYSPGSSFKSFWEKIANLYLNEYKPIVDRKFIKKYKIDFINITAVNTIMNHIPFFSNEFSEITSKYINL